MARANGVNANQVFKWRRALKRGELSEPTTALPSLLPVMLTASSEKADVGGHVDLKEESAQGGSIHIEIPGKAMISVERGADPVLLRMVVESLRK